MRRPHGIDASAFSWVPPASSVHGTQKDTLALGLAAKPQRAAPPRQLELPPAGAAKFVICDHTIEGWHRILKSGCRLEERQLATSERLQRCLTLYSVIAWRVFYAIMLARAVPEISCSVLLEIEEWQALYCAIHYCPTPPDSPPSLDQAGRWIAQLGGFVGRRRRDQPGAETVWRGLQHLTDLTRMYRIRRPAPP
ncbi:MAG TPA: IS4 family transposase [Candidatus Tectomicrobia bacterium]|nr:IS4 family transposase [Candidatus Tectomicrobia bacterium]